VGSTPTSGIGGEHRNDAGSRPLCVLVAAPAGDSGNPRATLAQPVTFSAVTAETRTNEEERFVEFGPKQAREAREAAGLPEPTEAPPNAGALRRWWTWLTRGNGEERKLWASDAPAAILGDRELALDAERGRAAGGGRRPTGARLRGRPGRSRRSRPEREQQVDPG
jgi:hypothetical protein